ncbi:MAG: hypothetical protein H7A25_22185 [Leptospiraceae bacterium]|nr:hypothetical protein [Leptospiraceae bacterium]
MPTASVTTTHQSGGLTFSDVIPDRVHGKVGVAETGEVNKIYYIQNLKQAENIFGRGQLIDSLKQYFEEFDEELGQKPVPLLCVRPDNDIPGIVATPTLEGSGLATIAINGSPSGSRSVKIKITKAGAGGIAEYRKSVDGGLSYGAPLVTPVSGASINLDVGVSATFTDDVTSPEQTFALGDVWSFEISGPAASNSSRLAAFEAFKQEYRVYWIHLLGGVDRNFAVSLDSVLQVMETELNQPIFAVLEGMSFDEAEAKKGSDFADIAEYLQYIADEYDPFFSDRVCIVASEGRYIPGGIANAGGYEVVLASEIPLGEWRNAATLLTAKIASGAPNVSAAYVREKRSLTMSEIRYWKEGYQDYMDLLHDMRLTVLKEYNDYDGIFIARDRMKSGPDSDFVEIPERRRADKMHRIVYRESLQFLNQDTNIGSGSGGIKYIQAVADAAVSSSMEVSGRQEISKHEIIFDPDKDFSQTKILKAKLKMFIAGRIKAIEWTTSFAVTQ